MKIRYGSIPIRFLAIGRKTYRVTPLSNSFIELFRSAGYELCDDGNLEAGCEKIAIYALNDSPTHAARQLENGQWTSKLGKYEDIVHSTPDELQGEFDYAYGRVAVFMVRPRSGS